MESRPAMVEKFFSSGVATPEAIVSGLAPGRLALTVMVGKSTVGRSLTGSDLYPKAPKIRIPTITSVVVTGRRMNSPEMFMMHLFFLPPSFCLRLPLSGATLLLRLRRFPPSRRSDS